MVWESPRARGNIRPVPSLFFYLLNIAINLAIWLVIEEKI